MSDRTTREFVAKRTDLNNNIIAFDIRGLTPERVDRNQYVPNAQAILERMISEVKGERHKDTANFSDAVTFSFPTIKQHDILITLNFWNAFALYLDDFLDKKTHDQAHHVALWKTYMINRVSTGTDFMDIMYNVLSILLDNVFTPKLRQLHDQWYLDWLSLYDITEEVKVGKDIPTFEQYDNIRPLDIGFPPLQIYLYASLGFDPDDYPDIINNPNWELFHKWAGRHFYHSNDIYSSKKEIMQQQGKFTLIYIIMYNDNCDAQTASDKVVAMIHESWDMSVKYATLLAELNIPVLNEYTHAVMCILKGNVYWSSVTPRYQDMNKYKDYKLGDKLIFD
ncbi:unnamed protein product [Oppiella nova]|uniref:Terpene synthase n=1 Tax=Oppiella nova TaxID=334625 RepID=A0A7R9M2B2_9ACAR|nr:unnamed protein product [Oppiella nova]CAG2169223.1 unnamed protein product [Oppiella nova]